MTLFPTTNFFSLGTSKFLFKLKSRELVATHYLIIRQDYRLFGNELKIADKLPPFKHSEGRDLFTVNELWILVRSIFNHRLGKCTSSVCHVTCSLFILVFSCTCPQVVFCQVEVCVRRWREIGWELLSVCTKRVMLTRVIWAKNSAWYVKTAQIWHWSVNCQSGSMTPGLLIFRTAK